MPRPRAWKPASFLHFQPVGAWCVAARSGSRTLPGMRDRHDARLEIRMPAASRRELDEFACEAGLSKADLVRLGLKWLLQNRDVLLKLPAAPGDGRVSSQ